MAEGDDDPSLIGKLVATGVVLFLAPFVEVGTGAFPAGTAGALVALAVIWGFEDEAQEVQETV
jgi:hypothetical protein